MGPAASHCCQAGWSAGFDLIGTVQVFEQYGGRVLRSALNIQVEFPQELVFRVLKPELFTSDLCLEISLLFWFGG